ncbi:RNA polymerase sigma factor [Marinifilum sp.]|uniref:RNA polymerase sigma factor n=1 Tax=Marinifilum sp. TaxID=2033137 RepID=UPI003BABE408
MYHSLCLYGEKIIPESDIVEDAVQEAFIALWDKRKDLDSIFRIKGYLYTVVRNKIITHLRLKKTVSIENNLIEAEEEETDLQVLREETYKILRSAIENLPERTKLVMNYKIGGYTNKEIAENLNISVNTVKTLQKVGYTKLREQLKENVFALILLAELL